jgi:hypothetical protein
MLLLTGIIAPAFVVSPADASGRTPKNAKAAQVETERVSAKAKKDANFCQELQPCIGDKLISIEATLRDILALTASAAFADPPLGTIWQNSEKCSTDSYNVIYGNSDSKAVDTRVTFFVKNSGECPLEISVGDRIGDRVGEALLIPQNGKGERTGFTVPKGLFLRVRCSKSADKKCEYLLTNILP